ELIADYAGTVILVSHDRDFLDRTVTSTLTSDGDGNWQDYPGGYSDMLSQRGKRPEKAAGGKAKSRKANKLAAVPKNKAKLSFNQQHALKTLPKDMEKLGTNISALEALMADPELFTMQPDKFAKAAKDLEEAQKSLAEKEEQWLELEMLREEIEG
ncbi:MAG: ABC transporter ATP-binding protein, partial [Hyphomicrobiales bacterium]